MKLLIQIECDTIEQFQQHLLSMYEQATIFLHEQSKKEEPVTDVDEFPADLINAEPLLDDNNCYGSRNVFLVNSFK